MPGAKEIVRGKVAFALRISNRRGMWYPEKGIRYRVIDCHVVDNLVIVVQFVLKKRILVAPDDTLSGTRLLLLSLLTELILGIVINRSPIAPTAAARDQDLAGWQQHRVDRLHTQNPVDSSPAV